MHSHSTWPNLFARVECGLKEGPRASAEVALKDDLASA